MNSPKGVKSWTPQREWNHELPKGSEIMNSPKGVKSWTPQREWNQVFRNERAFPVPHVAPVMIHPKHNHGPLSKRRGSEKKAYLGEMKAWLGSMVDICTSMCAYNMYYSGKLS